MRAGIAAFVIFIAGGTAAIAADQTNIKGLWLTTDYPALQLRAGEDVSLPLTLYNYGLDPQRTTLSIPDKPANFPFSREMVGSAHLHFNKP